MHAFIIFSLINEIIYSTFIKSEQLKDLGKSLILMRKQTQKSQSLRKSCVTLKFRYLHLPPTNY